MALRRKGSAPWSLTKETGLSDAPVSGSPFVEGDEVKPVIDAGFIDSKGLWQINKVKDDQQFTFQDPNQALAAGATIEFPINMLNHDSLIFAILDSSGNGVNVDLLGLNPTTVTGPYTPFADVGVNGDYKWRVNKNATDGTLYSLLEDTSETLSATWIFNKTSGWRGTQIRFLIASNEGSDAGTISTAYMRLV